jgi:protocatechuate 3,4-dioxygenase beta subunit
LLDPAFGYRANLRTDADGRFILVTILPASYAEHPEVTPHIHVAVSRPGRNVVNREIVFRNHPAQRTAPPAHTRACVADLVPADEREPGSLQCAVALATDR